MRSVKFTLWPQVGLLSIPFILSITGVAHSADAPKSDKSGYHLFNPTPKGQMRDLSTDRPDRTESPYTVDAGHFQIEMDLGAYTRDQAKDGVEATSVAVANTNLKAGLTNYLDFQVVIPSFAHESVKVGGATETAKGFGDVTLRTKVNLVGNDGGDVAVGLMPFVKLPTASERLGNERVEGGIILPIGMSLPGDFGLGTMFVWNRILNESGQGYHTELTSSVTVSRGLFGELGGYVEVFSNASNETGAEWYSTFDAGLTYGLTQDIQLDVGANFGLTESAEGLNPFVGATFRF